MQLPLALATPVDHAEALHQAPRHGTVICMHAPGSGRWIKIAPEAPLAKLLAGEAGGQDRFLTVNQFHGWRLVKLLKSLRTAFADLDGPSAPRTVQGAIEACADAGLPRPGFVVLSGRGCHLYWPLAPTPAKALPVWQAVERGIVEALAPWGSDRAATDCTRVLRLAGTVNSKSGTAAVGWQISPERWTLHELADYVLGPRPSKPAAVVSMARARPKATAFVGGGTYRLWHSRYLDLCTIAERQSFMRASGVPEGCRDTLLFLLANALSWFTRSDSLEREIELVARTFLPSLTLAEVKEYTGPIVRRALATDQGGKEERYRFRTETLREWLGPLLEPVQDQLRVLLPRAVLAERERERLRRRDGVMQDRAEYLAQFSKSQNSQAPWEALGISRATYFRRKAKSAALGTY